MTDLEPTETPCEHCNGHGWTAEHNRNCVGFNCGSQCPVQVQCAACRATGFELVPRAIGG